MKKIFALAVIISVAFLTACSSINSGTITNKVHQPGYHSTTFVCSGYTSQGSCTAQMPITTWTPDSYRFDISQDGKNGWVTVCVTTFNKYEIGDYYSKN